MKSEVQYVREKEVRDARRRRGECSICGHTWRVKNPSPGVNRCPGCGIRGNVKYQTFSDEAG